MPRTIEWEIPSELQPKAEDFGFDLDQALTGVLGLQATIPDDAFSASTLGTERAGSGVLIRKDGLVLTIGYLITEAESIWLTSSVGGAVPATVLGYDQETGFGLVQALGRLNVPPIELGAGLRVGAGDKVVIAAEGGRRHAIAATVVARQEFAGHWEYLLDRAIFTAPAHPFWGGTGLIGGDGRLLGIGSLHVQQVTEPDAPPRDINMVVPIDLLKPILDELLTYGKRNKAPRPWLGIFTVDNDAKVVVARVSERGPAAVAGIKEGDAIWAVRDESVTSVADFYRKLWASGTAGTEIPIEVMRDDGRGSARTIWLRVKSADRASFLKRPQLQ